MKTPKVLGYGAVGAPVMALCALGGDQGYPPVNEEGAAYFPIGIFLVKGDISVEVSALFPTGNSAGSRLVRAFERRVTQGQAYFPTTGQTG